MRVLVCGGRHYTNRDRVFDYLDALHKEVGITDIIHGAARGADTLAEDWAKSRQIHYHGYPAKWVKHGKPAGPIRNSFMANNTDPHLVVAFPGNIGTPDMINKAKAKGIEVREVGQ